MVQPHGDEDLQGGHSESDETLRARSLLLGRALQEEAPLTQKRRCWKMSDRPEDALSQLIRYLARTVVLLLVHRRGDNQDFLRVQPEAPYE